MDMDKFSVYDDIRAKLLAGGIPAELILDVCHGGFVYGIGDCFSTFGLLAVLTCFALSWQNGLGMLIVAWLVSPLGIPLVIAMHHRVPLHLHAAHQLKLTVAALQIVLRTMHTEIGIPRQIVCQKAYAAFQCHQFSAQRQGRALRFCQRIAACVQKAPVQRPVAFQRKPYLLQVRFILCARVCP